MAAFDYNNEAELFDYSAEAELFPARRSRKFGRGRIGYRRFARAGDAIRLAIEELPPSAAPGAPHSGYLLISLMSELCLKIELPRSPQSTA